MINFDTPQAIGFGVARGTACCLYSGEDILDYSGHLLNLASRLNDLARPSGIVIDGGFQHNVIPISARSLFKEQSVYVRSIAEEIPIKVFYLNKYVQLSENALSPLVGENWQTVEHRFTAKQFGEPADFLIIDLPQPAKAREKILVTLLVPKPGSGVKGLSTVINFKAFTYAEDGPNYELRLNMNRARELVEVKNKPVTFKIDFLPKPGSSIRRS
jgi:hypothetical protein